jgi:Kef-type K+ transport system membrane component KefB
VSSFVTLKLFSYETDQSVKISSGFVTLSEMTIVIASLAVAKLSPAAYISIIAAFMIINTISPLFMSLTFGGKTPLNSENHSYKAKRLKIPKGGFLP